MAKAVPRRYRKRHMRHVEAQCLLRFLMDQHGLNDWDARITVGDVDDTPKRYTLGCCVFEDKAIYLTAYCIQKRTPRQVQDTILHEIAHALTGDETHGEVWAKKAEELGVRLPEILRAIMHCRKTAVDKAQPEIVSQN